MIHVDINYDRTERDVPLPKVLVQTSVDGAGWMTQYVVYAQADEIQRAPVGADEARERQRREAEHIARIFMNGCRFAGAEVRATAFGYAL